MDININKLTIRVDELSQDLEITYEQIFDTVCEENFLDSNSIAEAFGCKCPFALIGFVSESSLENC